jgi:biopolymer transport protein TolR
MRRRHLKRLRPMSQINVVPYIDVMLVLLIIFMVTAPLLSLGVKVDLPEADASPISEEESQEPLVVSITRAGEFFLSVGENKEVPIDPQTLKQRIAKVFKYNPETSVMVQGDNYVPYGKVVEAMVMIQQAGAPSVGLITDPPEE